ncbi:MarR family transcriptional regulator [Candidatus Mcinerneyibacteriota bacterium]|nr:MarR family transcriptional regulator [Candidatus Mcinerneyibacteriota bacterium]
MSEQGLFAQLELAFRRFYVKLFRYGRGELAKFGISGSQFNIIVTVYFQGPQSLKDLCERLALAPSTISEMIVRMEDAGLVIKKKDEQDKRKILIDLTEESKKIVISVIDARVRYVKEISQGIDKKQLEILRDTLESMLECQE